LRPEKEEKMKSDDVILLSGCLALGAIFDAVLGRRKN
jgi:hypothetical protein